MSSAGRLRAAVIGAGLMGRWHAHASVHAGGRVTAVVDPDAARAGELAGKHSGAVPLTDCNALIDGSLADVVHICTPIATHEALVRRMLEAGLHVLVEKPLTDSAPETAALVKLAADRGTVLCPVHQFLFQPGVLRLLESVAEIGPILHLDATACSAGAPGGPAERARVAADILPHPLSLLARILPVSLRSLRWTVHQPEAGELRASASGASVSASLLVSMRGRPTTNSLRVICERGTVHADLFHGFSVVESGGVSRVQKVLHPFTLAGRTIGSGAANLVGRAARSEPAYPGLLALVSRFYEAVRDHTDGPIPAAEVLDVAEVRDRLLALAEESGRPA